GRRITTRVIANGATLSVRPPRHPRTDEGCRVDPLIGTAIRQRAALKAVGMLSGQETGAGTRGIPAREVGRFVGPALDYKDVAETPSAQQSIHKTACLRQKRVSAAKRQLVNRCGEPALAAACRDLAVFRAPAIEVHRGIPALGREARAGVRPLIVGEA